MTKKWTMYREEILKLYLEQAKPLHEVRQIMEQRHGFEASVRAYRSRFDKWKITKYKCQRRRNSTTTVVSTISSTPGDNFLGSPAFSPTIAHPPVFSRLYPSQELGRIVSSDFVGMDHSHLTLTHNPRPPQTLYLPMDAENQSPVESHASSSPASTLHALGFPYSSVSGHSYDDMNVTGSDLHTPAHIAPTTENAPYLFSWRNDASSLDCHSSTQLHDSLKAPYWWLNHSTVAGILEELNYADVNQQNSYGETPLFLILRCLQKPVHPSQIDVLLRLLRSPGLNLRCQFQENYNPIGLLVEITLDSVDLLMKNEDLAVALCKCLRQLLDLGADPNILVRGTPIVHNFLQNVNYNILSYTTFWPVLSALCKSTAPDLYDSSGNTALHCAVSTRAKAGVGVDERMRAAIGLLLQQSRERGMLNSRNNHGRTALHLLVEGWTVADDEFWHISRDFVRAGADTHELIPEDFAERLHKLARSKHAGDLNILQQFADGTTPLPVVVWLSACAQQLSMRQPSKETWQEHLAALEMCAGPWGVKIGVLKSLPRSC